jgi:hypothetical protein
MSFFTDTENSPTIVDDTTKQNQVLQFVGGASVSTWRKTVTWVTQRHTWLTKAAADSIAAAKNNPPTVTATSKRMNDIGAYQVIMTTKTDTVWVEDT